MRQFIKVLNQYADFKGRVSRSEYWMFVLVNTLVTFIISVMGFGLMTWTGKEGALLFPFLYSMSVLIPCLAVTVRRLHDTGRNVWFVFVNLIPVVGSVLFIIALCKKGNIEENFYGKNPNTTNNFRYHRKRSAAVALMLAATLWFFSCSTLYLFFPNGFSEQIFYLLLPLGLFVTGAALFSRRAFSAGVALSLIALSAFWLFLFALKIRMVIAILAERFDIMQVINLLTVLVPIALLLSGLYILLKKSDRTIPACLLFVGSFIWIISILISDTLSNISPVYIYALVTNMVIVAPVSLFVFARTLLLKEKPVNESKNALSVPEKDEKSAAPPLFQAKQADDIVQVLFEKESESVSGQAIAEKIPEPVVSQKVTIQPIVGLETKLKEEHISQAATGKPTIQEPIVNKPISMESRRNVVFIREDRDNCNVWHIYKAPSKVHAMSYLSKITVDKPSYFVVVETPEGNFGRDKDGIYQE